MAIPNYVPQQCAPRQSAPQDLSRKLFQQIYESLVFASKKERTTAIKAIIAIYGLEV